MKINLSHFKLFLACLVLCSSESMAQGYYGTHFRHEVTPENSTAIDTYIDHPELNNNSNAIIIASANLEPNQIPVGDNFSVFFNPDSAKWAIRNADGENSFPPGSTFNVLIPSTGGSFFRVVAPGGDNMFLINSSATNGNPQKKVFITPIYPGYTIANGSGQFVAMYLPAPFNQWTISGPPSYDIEAGETFNVFVPDESNHTFVHRVTEENESSSVTEIDHPLLNGHPEMNFIFQRQFNFTNDASSTYNLRKKSTAYIDGKWHIRIDDGNTFYANEDYNIAILNTIAGESCQLPQLLACGDSIAGNTQGIINDNENSNPIICSEDDIAIGTGGQHWYKFIPENENYLVTVSTCEDTNLNTEINVYTGSCGDFTCVNTEQLACDGAAAAAVVTFNADPGNEYFVRIGGFASSEGDYTVEVNCQVTTGMDSENRDKPNIELYPNPVSHLLNVNWNQAPSQQIQYEVLDLSGKSILAGTSSGGSSFVLDVNTVPNGVYFLRLKSNGQMGNKKLIVLH